MSLIYCSDEVLSPQEQRLNPGQSKQNLPKFARARTGKIFNTFNKLQPRIDIERGKYFTQSFKTTEGQPLILRWAKALSHVAKNIPVYIDDYQLLAGDRRASCRERVS